MVALGPFFACPVVSSSLVDNALAAYQDAVCTATIFIGCDYILPLAMTCTCINSYVQLSAEAVS